MPAIVTNMISSLDGQMSVKVRSPDQQKSTELSSLDQETSQKTSVPDSSLDSEVLETVSSLGPVNTSEKDFI